MPRPKLNPTKEQRQQVEFLAAIGVRQEEIAEFVGIRSPKTLRKHFRAEMDRGATRASFNVGARADAPAKRTPGGTGGVDQLAQIGNLDRQLMGANLVLLHRGTGRSTLGSFGVLVPRFSKLRFGFGGIRRRRLDLWDFRCI